MRSLRRVEIVPFQNTGHREVQARRLGDGKFGFHILGGVEAHLRPPRASRGDAIGSPLSRPEDIPKNHPGADAA